MIVVDASAAVLGLLNDGEARSRLSEDALASPHLVDSEIANAMRAQVSRGDIEAGDAKRAISTWARLGVDRYAAVGLLDRIWELRSNLTSYDATYVALAEALECGLLTADRRLARAPGPLCPVIVVKA